jgi:hypothetical protein
LCLTFNQMVMLDLIAILFGIHKGLHEQPLFFHHLIFHHLKSGTMPGVEFDVGADVIAQIAFAFECFTHLGGGVIAWPDSFIHPRGIFDPLSSVSIQYAEHDHFTSVAGSD